jgi:predicted ester cyclase
MMTEVMIDGVRQFVSELNNGDLDSVHKFIACDFFTYSPKPDEPDATEVFFEILSDFKAAFSDFHISIDKMDLEVNQVKARVTLSGTHENPLWGAPASNDKISWPVQLTIRSVGDRFAINLDNLTARDIAPLLRQVNLVPSRDMMDKPHEHPVSLPEIILRMIYTGQVADKSCRHLHQIKVIEPETDVCQECIDLGDVWPALRMCLICGYVGCCDTSKNKHMKQHYQTTGHPLFRSIRLDEGWVWCYEDSAFFSKRILER